ncbi:hypothetical protein NPIL_8381 [Nephila pilipes]|uniref:Uncharacterized protein n=1 Tax=Nephila pilipes TaxID=299642 RepID=A0A8X6U8Y1_NEPPI|nr:hypothetical protein NPIL_8381 [Nephila pilipes]
MIKLVLSFGQGQSKVFVLSLATLPLKANGRSTPPPSNGQLIYLRLFTAFDRIRAGPRKEYGARGKEREKKEIKQLRDLSWTRRKSTSQLAWG